MWEADSENITKIGNTEFSTWSILKREREERWEEGKGHERKGRLWVKDESRIFRPNTWEDTAFIN